MSRLATLTVGLMFTACQCFHPVAEFEDGGVPFDAGRDDSGHPSDTGASNDGGTDAGPCLADTHEDDDSLPQVQMAPPIGQIVGSPDVEVGPLTACQGDPDYFRAYSDCCLTVGATVEWNSTANLTVELLQADGGLILPDVVIRDAGYLQVLKHQHGWEFFILVQRVDADFSYRLKVRSPMFGP